MKSNCFLNQSENFMYNKIYFDSTRISPDDESQKVSSRVANSDRINYSYAQISTSKFC